MEIIVHRVNSIAGLLNISCDYGCEIDIRARGSRLILNHEPFEGGEFLEDYLDNYSHGTLVLNIKEAGIEASVLQEVRKREIPSYFLLDVEFPYLYRASRNGERAIAVRYSEDEPIELAENYSGMVDWVWIDTNTKLPLDTAVVKKLKPFSTCLVCPERWNRPNDILPYKIYMKSIGFEPDAVMTGLSHLATWQQSL